MSRFTVVRAAHITELRNRINALRLAYGLGTFNFVDPALSAGNEPEWWRWAEVDATPAESVTMLHLTAARRIGLALQAAMEQQRNGAAGPGANGPTTTLERLAIDWNEAALE